MSHPRPPMAAPARPPLGTPKPSRELKEPRRRRGGTRSSPGRGGHSKLKTGSRWLDWSNSRSKGFCPWGGPRTGVRWQQPLDPPPPVLSPWSLARTLLTRPIGVGCCAPPGHGAAGGTRQSRRRRKGLTTSPDGDSAARSCLHTGHDERDRGHRHQPSPNSPPRPELQRAVGKESHRGRMGSRATVLCPPSSLQGHSGLEPAQPRSSERCAHQAVRQPGPAGSVPTPNPPCSQDR